MNGQSRWHGAAMLCLWSAIVAILDGCGSRVQPARFVGTLERDRVEIIAEEAEPILALEVREGAHVTPGQVLVRQETQVSAARIAQARAQIEQARQRLTELERGERVEVIQQARARVAAAQAALDRDEREYRRSEELVRERLISQAQRDQDRAARDSSRANLHDATEQLNVLLHGNRVEDIEQARAVLAASESAERELTVTDARLIVRATRPGIIEALPYKMGERPPKGAPVVVMLADTPAFARIYVPEPERAHVRPGMRARVHVDGLQQPLGGFVRFIASDAAFTPYFALNQRDRSRLTFLAEVQISDVQTGQRLPAGVPVEVEILGGPDG
jgi:HlyD family secretion protein